MAYRRDMTATATRVTATATTAALTAVNDTVLELNADDAIEQLTNLAAYLRPFKATGHRAAVKTLDAAVTYALANLAAGLTTADILPALRSGLLSARRTIAAAA